MHVVAFSTAMALAARASLGFQRAGVRERRGLMIRRGALTLGAVLILGGGTGARGDDLSGPVAVTTTSGTLSSWGGVLPTLPENWSDLPVRFKVSESVGYNSNVLKYPTNFSPSGGFSKGDFQSSSNYGASTKANWGGQQIFMNGSVGFTRYLHDVSLNSFEYNVNTGLNWIYTSRCAGTLVASQSKSSSIPTVGSSHHKALPLKALPHWVNLRLKTPQSRSSRLAPPRWVNKSDLAL